MRKIPFGFAHKGNPTGEPPKLIKKSFDESVITDLTKEFKRPETKPDPPKPEPKPNTEENTETTTQEQETPDVKSAKLREDIGKVQEKLKEEIKVAIENPKRASKNVLKFLNLIRMFVYPWIYKKILFEGQELEMYDAVLKKIIAAKLANKEPELNVVEKELHDKMEFFKKQKLNVPWTEGEIDEGAEIAYAKLAEIKFLSWLMENEWAVYFMVIEGKRFGPVIGHRMGFGEISL